MMLVTRESAVHGTCDFCPDGTFEPGDFIAETDDGEALCPSCLTWAQRWMPILQAWSED